MATSSNDAAPADESGSATFRLELMHILENLKTTKRTGWVREGVKDPESISDHMYRMAMLALFSEDKSLDVSKCVLLAIVHDLAEATVGDLTPFDPVPVSKAEKQRLEEEAMRSYTDELLGGGEAGKRVWRLWREYEDGETREAKFVKDLDRFELALQAVEYERRQRLPNLQPFFHSSVEKIVHPEVRSWANTLMDERRDMHGSTPFATGFKDVRPLPLPPAKADEGPTNADAVAMAREAEPAAAPTRVA